MNARHLQGLTANSVHNDFLQAQCDLEAAHGKDYVDLHPELVALGAIWRSLERLNKVVQTSAQVGDWKSSEAATIAKGRELGIEARPGESMASYRARIGQGGKS